MNDTFIKAYQDQLDAAKKAFSANGMPAFEVPPAMREAAEKGLSACRDNYDKIKSSAEQMNAAIEDTCTTASKGVSTFNVKMLEALQTNMNSSFDYFNALLSAKTFAEAVELSTGHARKQFEIVSAQAKDLSALAQKVAADTSEPLKSTVEKSVRPAA
ncbi:phasin [Xanthobacter tagetidis]|uniref:Phasin n=1 Tax=Xanthobacter tagetidis TaxID=60216 RepID=A0A3L7A1W9_9HYPH|nr:phasin [Xanthobacter tagetidis]MBB6309459.1 phasin [Xanthobacter tagetidis]RLP73571.1 phasin [Xanthobacter tagetidis]